MRVLAIDPGLNTGWAIADNLNIIGAGKIKAKASLSLEQKLKQLHDGVSNLFTEYPGIKVMVIEDQFLGKNVKTIKSLSRTVGVILLAAAQYGVRCCFYPPSLIKQATTSHGGADKEDVISAIGLIYKGNPIVENVLSKAKIDNDITDAMALIYTFYVNPDEASSF